MSVFKHPYNLRTQDVDAKVLRSTYLTYQFLFHLRIDVLIQTPNLYSLYRHAQDEDIPNMLIAKMYEMILPK